MGTPGWTALIVRRQIAQRPFACMAKPSGRSVEFPRHVI